MSKVIVHIDLNAFYVRCEEIKDPSLIGKPVAVGGEGRRGIVSTCSYKAREYGVRSGMPMFQAKILCPNLIIKKVDWHFYNVKSRDFFDFVFSYTNLVEGASCDECYADFTDVLKGVDNVETFFKTFQNNLYKKHQLKCSIGIATTKFLAKMGSDIKKPMGITIIRNKDIKNILSPLPIKDFFGIGKKTYPILEKNGVKTIGDLIYRIDTNDEATKGILGNFYYLAKDWWQGKGDNNVNVVPFDPKSVGCSSTLSHDTDSLEEIKSKLEYIAKEVSRRAKKEGKIGSTIQLVVKESDFTSHNKSRSLQTLTNDWLLIYQSALSLFESNFLNKSIRLVGITLQNLRSQKDINIQMSFYDYEMHEEQASTKLLINEINRKFKKTVVKRASEVDDVNK